MTLIAEVVDHVGIVAGAARHRVVARAAIQDIGPAVAGERVVARAAGEVLDGRERVLDGRRRRAAPRVAGRRLTNMASVSSA